jgi:signal transduction histidine kinase
MFIDMSSIMLLDPAKREYHLYVAEGEKEKEVQGLFFTRDDPFVQILEREKKELTKYDFFEDPKYRTVSQTCIRNFRILYASMMIPLIFHEEVVGILNLGEKKSGKFYNRKDVELLRTLANQTALAVENVRLHQARVEALEHSRKDLERLNRVKSIALDHLSHELKTPLSVIQGSIRLLKHKVEMQTGTGEEEKSFETLERQLNRLLDIQRETDAIIRSYRELEEEPISVFSLAEQTLEEVKQRASHRNIHFYLEGQKDLSLLLPPKIMADILEGLLRNAVENTPDEGMVRVVLEQKAQWILVKVRDFGVGISDENQRHLFDGLFHTQSTELYASKRPYDFNAGGKGLDLLKIKVYGQRFGFDISVGSRRCIHLPTDRDLCPGRISLCSHCQEISDCLASGGSTFCVTFPVGGNRAPEGNKEHGKETSSS